MEQNSSAYQECLDEILSTPLSPENVQSYASDAIDEVAELVNEARADYVATHYGPFKDVKHEEDSAMRFHGLVDVNSILEFLDMKQSEINKIGQLVVGSLSIDQVIVPPDSLAGPEIGSGRGWEEKDTISRLQTILFLLKNEFNQDVFNPQEIGITKGIVANDMIRKTSYYMIEATKLNRTILVCNEEGNVTYVFDQAKLTAANISPEKLQTYTKKQLNTVLNSVPNSGKRLIYTENYVDNINKAIAGNFTTKPNNQSRAHKQTKPSYLQMPVPYAEDYGAVSFHQAGKELRINANTVKKLVEELGIQTGDFRFGKKTAKGFMPEDLDKLKQTDEYLVPHAEDYGAVSFHQAAEELGINEKTVRKLVEELGIQTGDFRFGTNIGRGLMFEDLDTLKQTDEYLAPHAEDYGAVSFKQAGKELGIAQNTAKKLVEELGIQTGDFKFWSIITRGFMPEDLEKLKQTDEYLTPHAEDYGAVSFNQARKELEVDAATIKKMIEELRIQTGDFKFGPKVARGLMFEDLEKLKQTDKYLVPHAEDYGVVSLRQAGEELGIARETIKKMIEDLRIQTGDFRFGPNITRGFMLEDLEKLKQTDEYLTPHAEDYGAVSLGQAGEELGIAPKTVKKLVEELGVQTGDFRFGPRIAKGFMSEDLGKLKNHLERNQ